MFLQIVQTSKYFSPLHDSTGSSRRGLAASPDHARFGSCQRRRSPSMGRPAGGGAFFRARPWSGPLYQHRVSCVGEDQVVGCGSDRTGRPLSLQELLKWCIGESLRHHLSSSCVTFQEGRPRHPVIHALTPRAGRILHMHSVSLAQRS